MNCDNTNILSRNYLEAPSTEAGTISDKCVTRVTVGGIEGNLVQRDDKTKKVEHEKVPLRPACNGCNITWREYMSKDRVEKEWDIVEAICYGVFEHPHLSDERVIDRCGVPFDWPIHWVVGEMCSDDNTPPEKTQLDALKHIIAHGANVNQPASSTQWTALMEALDPKIFQYLLSQGADVHARDSNNCTLIHKRLNICETRNIHKVLALLDEDVVRSMCSEYYRGKKPVDRFDDWLIQICREEYEFIQRHS